MPLNSFTDHIDDLLTHIGRVQLNAKILAERLAESGQEFFARALLAKAHVHDASKWYGIEWDYLHRGPDIDVYMLKSAVDQHRMTNDHHPEFHGGLEKMPVDGVQIAEMVCDWLARAQEMGTDFREWVRKEAPKRYNFDAAPAQVAKIYQYTELLLPKKFA